MLGFPCNQFGGQEPGDEADIKRFVTDKYQVDFPMFAKIDVNGEDEAPLYALLKKAQPGDGDTPDITWNFEKFVVDQTGTVVARFAPPTTPEELDEYVQTLGITPAA